MLSWTGNVESGVSAAGEEVCEVGEVVESVVLVDEQAEASAGRPVCSLLLLPALESRSCCSCATSCADSWSCTYIMWAPIPRLMVRGERPDRKSLICRIARKETLEI